MTSNPETMHPTLQPEVSGLLSLVSIGPGDLQQLTLAAQAALRAAQVIIGYQGYLDLVRPMLGSDQETMSSPLGREIERAQQAVDLAAADYRVALISSGDIGIYAMASPVFEVLHQRGWSGQHPEVEVFPGISALQAAAARLGAPLGHDFCAISLSDLLTPWAVIERRLQAAAWADFVIAFYNPRSQKRHWQLRRAVEILLAYRPVTTPVAVVRQITRPDEQVTLTSLAELEPTQVDMFTLVLVGNSQSYRSGEYLVTPRGYLEGDEEVGRRAGEEMTSRGAAKPGEPGLESPSHVVTGSHTINNEYLESPCHPVTESYSLSGPDVYPLTLTGMAGLPVVVVGGGPVGQRKVQGLLAAGAAIRLVSPQVTPSLQAWAEAGHIQWQRHSYQPGDLVGARLVFAATNRRTVNAQVAQEAASLGLLCNVADQPAEGNFHVPAVHRQPGLVVAVSTNGEDPGRARVMRDQIASWLKGGGEQGSGGAEEAKRRRERWRVRKRGVGRRRGEERGGEVRR